MTVANALRSGEFVEWLVANTTDTELEVLLRSGWIGLLIDSWIQLGRDEAASELREWKRERAKKRVAA